MPSPPRHTRSSVPRAVLVAAGALLASGCLRGPEAPAPGAALDAAAEAEALREATAVDRPVSATLDWAYREGNFRFRGDGALRLAPGPRARLDLFLPNGTTVLRTALVEDDLRIPPGVRRDMVPSPPLLWGAFGIFRPGTPAVLLGGSELASGDRRLRYGVAGGEEIHVRYRDLRLLRVERVADGRIVEEVSVDPDSARPLPGRSVYRRHREGRFLEVHVNTVQNAEPFPPSIWLPGT